MNLKNLNYSDIGGTDVVDAVRNLYGSQITPVPWREFVPEVLDALGIDYNDNYDYGNQPLSEVLYQFGVRGVMREGLTTTKIGKWLDYVQYWVTVGYDSVSEIIKQADKLTTHVLG